MTATSIELPPLDRATMGDYLRAIRPTADEVRWREIPWQTDLCEAVRLAKEQGKPIFLWTMNGNPLGCT